MPLKLPTPLLPYQGKKVFRFYVKVSQSGLHRDLWEHHAMFPVIARTPTAAVHMIQDELGPKLSYPTEFECAGPKGGITHRFMGYESCIAAQMFACRPVGRQLEFSL